MTRAVVFAYHDVGCRCLEVLLDRKVEVPLVVTHADDPKENLWFGSVAAISRAHGVETATPDDPNTHAIANLVGGYANTHQAEIVDFVRNTNPEGLAPVLEAALKH